MQSRDIPEAIVPYIECLKRQHPMVELTPELITTFIWFQENRPARPVDHAVFDAVVFIKEIQEYIDLAKQMDPDTELDIEMLDAFENIKINLESESIAYGLNIAKAMHACIVEWKREHPYENVTETLRHYLCYTLDANPELLKLPPSKTLAQAKFIEQRIAIFVKAAPPSSGRIKLNIKKIKNFVWMVNKYPHLTAKQADDWCSEISRSTKYRQVEQLFPPTYPFSWISFSTETTGKACLQIFAKTILSAPWLYSLLSIPNTRKGYLDKGILLDFDLKGEDTPQQFLERFNRFFRMIEITLLPRGEEDLFHRSKWKFLKAARQFLYHYQTNFPGLTWAQMHLPETGKGEDDTPIGKSMRLAIDKMDYTGLQKMLAIHANPNQTQYDITMLGHAANQVRDYNVRMMYGPLTDEHCKELWENFVNATNFLDNCGYQIIISKQDNDYFISWCACSKFVITAPILRKADIRFLNTLAHYFDESQPGQLKSSNSVNHINRFTILIMPFVLTTLERRRKDKAQTVLKFVRLLMEYGADPAFRRHPLHPGVQTVVEALMDKSQLLSPDTVNKDLLKEILRLIILADKGRSHIRVANVFRQDCVGSLILAGEEARRAEGRLPPQIHSVTLIECATEYMLSIVNKSRKNVYLQCMSRKDFTEHDAIVDLCKRVFPWQSLMPETEFEAYIKKKLLPGKEVSLIDLVRDADGKIVGFNMADIVFPRNSEDPILHFIPLACSDTLIQKEFKELMSQISFQRINFLQDCFQRLVLTAYTSASAMSYLQVAKLSRVYPKHNCLRPQDLQQLCNVFFAGRLPLIDDDIFYFITKLVYHVDPKDAEFPDESIHNCVGYNNRIERHGCNPIVAFYSTPDNMQSLATKIKRHLAGDMTFFSIAKDAKKLNEPVFKLRSKL